MKEKVLKGTEEELGDELGSGVRKVMEVRCGQRRRKRGKD